jgi:outer membrane protein assembly factor BamB
MMRAAIAAALVAVLSGCAWAQGLFGGSGGSEPPAELTDFEPSLQVRTVWSAQVGKGTGRRFVRLIPAMDAGRIYAADVRGQVAAFDAASGARLWEVDTETPISAGVEADGGRVLVGTDQAEVFALDQDSGSIVWRAEVSSEVLAVPRAANGTVVVKTADGRLFGLDAADGKRLWVYQSAVPVLTLRGASAPVIVGDIAIAGLANGKLLALGLRDGRVLWETAIAVPHGRSELERMVDISGDPVYVEGIVYVSSYQGRVAAVDVQTGRLLWGYDISSYAGLAVDHDKVYVTDEQGHVWALDRRSGASLWKQDKLQGRAVTAPVVVDGSVVVGDYQGYLHWLAADTGRFQQRLRVDASGLLNPGRVQGDTLYTASRGGDLVALRTRL